MAGIIVIGASAGGVAALDTLIPALPPDLAVPVGLVLHVGAHRSRLAELLQLRTSLRVVWAEDGQRAIPGYIYVAPPDLHMVLEGDLIRTTHAPRENNARPAIDPLFRSAARYFGPAAIGVVLTGRLNDGTAGLYEIKRAGGIAVVQDPDTAEQPSMPRSAIAHVAVDHVVELDHLAPLLATLAAAASNRSTDPTPESSSMDASRPLKAPSAYTCPDCGGALDRIEDSTGLFLFRCHTGHRMTGEVLAAEQLRHIEDSLEATLRRLNESLALTRQFQDDARARADAAAVASWRLAETQVSHALANVLAIGERLPRADELPLG
jgi:two-component system, chemotaxis family, protein-glutamate methylesterase/glutaminase